MSAVRSRSVYEAACESAATTTEREMKFVYDVLAVKAKVGDMRIEGKRVVVAWVVEACTPRVGNTAEVCWTVCLEAA